MALVGLLGRRVASSAVGLTAAALAAVYPMLFLGEATLMSESLYVMLVTLVLLCTYRAYDDPKPARFAVLGLAVGAATLTRAEGALLGAVLAIGLGVVLRDLTARDRVMRVSTRARSGGRRSRAVDGAQRGPLPRVRARLEQRRNVGGRCELRRDLRRRPVGSLARELLHGG